MNKITITTLLYIIATTPAMAANMYVGVKVGNAYHGPSSFQNGGAIKKNNQLGAGFFSGYKIDEMYSIEAEYTKLGGFDFPTRTNKSNTVGLSGVALLPINKLFSAICKLGISKSTLENSAAPGYTGETVTLKNTSLSVGLGIQYNATPNVDFQVGVNTYQEGDAYSAMSSAIFWYTGGVFKF